LVFCFWFDKKGRKKGGNEYVLVSEPEIEVERKKKIEVKKTIECFFARSLPLARSREKQ
jgi:hypothetical protein